MRGQAHKALIFFLQISFYNNLKDDYIKAIKRIRRHK